MNQLFYGSICLTDLIEKAKSKHSAFSKAQNGKIYVNVNVWLNQEKDRFGNVMSIKVTPSKENKDREEGFYIGNCKPSDGPKPVNDNDINNLDVDIDPIATHPSISNDVSAQSDDLPF